MNEEQEESGKTVGWVKHDTKSILVLAIGNHVITHDLRISVSNNGRRIWNLHINNVKKADEGQYFCQINTDPMQNFMRNLQVVGNKVDPDELEPEFIATSSTTITTSTTTITTATTPTTEFIDESTDKKPMMLRYIILFLRK